MCGYCGDEDLEAALARADAARQGVHVADGAATQASSKVVDTSNAYGKTVEITYKGDGKNSELYAATPIYTTNETAPAKVYDNVRSITSAPSLQKKMQASDLEITLDKAA